MNKTRRRQEKRKKDFIKAKQKSKIYEITKAKQNLKVYKDETGALIKGKEISEVGRFRKDNHLNFVKDNHGYGTEKDTHNRRDKQQNADSDEQIEDYSNIVKPDAHEFLYSWD